MKKMIGLIVAALLLCGLAGQAMADSFFGDDELIRVVYNTNYTSAGQPSASGGSEVITALGNINTILSTVASVGSDTVGGGVNAFTSFQGFGSTVPFATYSGATLTSGLQVLYFATDWSNPNNGPVWTSGSQPLTAVPGGYGSGFVNTSVPLYAADNIAGYRQGATNTAVFSQVDAGQNSFWQNVEAPGAGNYSGFLANIANAQATEANLAPLASNTSVIQNLYYFPANGDLGGPGTELSESGSPVEILTNPNGSTTLEVVPVPDPPSALLLLSSLVGAIGFYRRAS